MNYAAPSITIPSRDLTRDEWWWLGMILLFAVRVYSNYALEEKAVDECTNSGGSARVVSSFFGSSWTVECYRN